MSFTRSRAARIGLLAGTVAVSAAAQLPVAAQSINATQLSVVVAPTKIVGTALGGEISFIGNGLSGGSVGTLTSTGAYQAGTAGTAAANTTFNFDLTVRAADVAPTATAASTFGNFASATSTYGTQKGYWSNDAGAAVGNLAISGVNAVTIQAGQNQGSTATAIFSTSMGSSIADTEIRRVATSSNDQATFDSTRQAARVQVGGSGLSAMSAVNMSAAILGATPTITPASGAVVPASNASTKTEVVRTGQAGAVLTASTSDITNPAYGTTTATTGGISAGGITATDMNSLTVVSGGGGTASTLSVIQTMTAF